MKKTVAFCLGYIFIFWISYISFFSFSSFSHRLLGYDINTLEEWLYHNRTFIIFISKITTLLIVLIIPKWSHRSKRDIVRAIKDKKNEIKKEWTINDKKWFSYAILSIVLYFLFFNFEYRTSEDLFYILFFNVIYNCAFYFCDAFFLVTVFDDTFSDSKNRSPWIASLIMSITTFSVSLLISQKPIFDVLQISMVMYIVFYLIRNTQTTYIGWVSLFFWGVVSSFVDKINLISSSNYYLYFMTPDGISLPWSSLLIISFVLYLKSPPYVDKLYYLFFSKSRKS